MTTENLGNLVVRVNGPQEEEYPHDNYSLDNLPYDGSVSVHFVTKINFDLSVELVDDKSPYAIIVHNTTDQVATRVLDSFEVTVPSDGYYEITTLIFPTTDFVEYGLGYKIGTTVEKDLHRSIIAAEINQGSVDFKVLTYTRDIESGYYTYTWNSWEDVTINDVLLMLENQEDTIIKKVTKSVFVYDTIYKCYINKAQELLSKYSGEKGFCTQDKLCLDLINKYKSEIQIRDYLWMAINVIKYCIQNNEYLKALKTLNCVNTCSGICSDIKFSNAKKINKGCGCGK